MNKEQVIDLEMSRINSSFQGLFLSLSNVVKAFFFAGKFKWNCLKKRLKSPFYSTHSMLIFRSKEETTNCSDLQKKAERMKFMCILLFILVLGIPLLKEAMGDA